MNIVPAMKWLPLVLTLFSPLAHADYFVGYTEYRYLPKLGIIQVHDGIVRGQAWGKRLQASPKEFEAQGIYPEYARVTKSYKRIDTVGPHKVETLITIAPPPGRGYGGANYVKNVVIRVDGKKKYDGTIGYNPREKELSVHEITVYADGIFEVRATAADKAILLPNEYAFVTGAEKTVTNEVLLATFASKGR